MNELIKFLTSTEVVIVYIVAGALIALCLLIYAIDRGKERRKKRHNTNELNKLVDKVQERLQEEKKVKEVVEVAPIKVKEESVEPKYMEEIIPTPTTDVKEMTYNELKEDVEELEYYDRTEPNREEALSELARITRELEEQANEEKVQEDLRRIEDAREKEAIISYDELLRKTANMNIIDDEENAVISINELNHKEEDPVKSELTEVIAQTTGDEPVILQSIEETDISNIKEDVSITSTLNNESTKFKRSPIISPIYGIEKNPKIEKQMEFENTANYEKLDAEIKKTNEFLSTIRELQKKLGD